eukprot:4112323-Amphidinium_carterae.1
MGVLVEATVLLLRQRAARVIEVRRLIGYWTHFCLLARPLLSLMSEVYRWIERGKGKERVLRLLTARLRDELWGLALLHTFMKVQLTSVINPCVYATDERGRDMPGCGLVTCPGGLGTDLLTPEPGSSTLVRDSEMEQVLETMQFAECSGFDFMQRSISTDSDSRGKPPRRQFTSDCTCAATGSLKLATAEPDDEITLATLVGVKDLFGTVVHTTCNPADAPTRGQRVKRGKSEEELLTKACEDYPVALFCMEQALKRGEKAFDGSLRYLGEGPFPAGRPREGKDLLATVQPLTKRRYDARVKALEEWLTVQGYPEMRALKVDQPMMLSALKAYLKFLYENSKPATWGTDLLAGLQFHHPDVIGRMGEIWSMQRQWQRLQPAWHWEWYRESAVLMLGYHLMLRPSELTGALRHHLVLPCDLSGDMGSGVLCIPRSKTLAVFGGDQPRVPLIPGGMRAFLLRFQQLKTALGLEHTAFNPSSLRGGGATEYIRRTGNLGYLQLRGRWLNPKSMHHYLQMGLAATA